MHIFRTTLLMGFLGMMLIGLPLDGMSAERGRMHAVEVIG